MELITFANLANVDSLIEIEDINLFDRVYSDGLLLTVIVNIFSRKKIARKSFDFTSLAGDVLFKPENRKIIFCGGSREEILSFEENLGFDPDRQWKFLDGYKGKSDLVVSIGEFQPNVVVLSLGSGLQEKYAIEIKKTFSDIEMQVYTSGAFISQTAVRRDYYPALIEALGLRWLFRAFQNTHVRKRLMNDYPRNIFRIIFDSSFRRKVLRLVS